MAVEAGIVAACGSLLLFSHALVWFAPLGVVGLLLLVFNLERTEQREERSILAQLVAIVGFAMAAPAAHYASLGAWLPTAVWLWGLSWTYFASSVFHVKTVVLGVQAQRRPALLRIRSSSRAYHALLAVLLVAGTLARRSVADDGEEGHAPKPPAPNPCAECHRDAARAGKHVVDPEALRVSVHGDMACDDCHSGYDTPAAGASHAKEGVSTVACTECHEDAGKAVAASVHGRGPSPGSPIPRAAGCGDCHGVHDVRKASDPASRLYPLNVPATCGACHGDVSIHPAGNGHGKVVAPPSGPGKWTDDTHARALLRSGLLVAPTCVTCRWSRPTRTAASCAARTASRSW